MSNILKFFLLIFFCCLILFSYLLNLNDNVYKKPKDYSIVHSKIKCPEKIKHFPNAIPIEAKNIKLYGHTTKNNDERLLLEFSIDKEYIIKELKNHDFINKNTKIGETQEIYYMQQIGHDIKNYENRATNCVLTNIQKSVDAARRQIEAIEKIKKSGRFELLSDELRYTAELRCENDSATLSELAALHDPSISKSGLNRRLENIMRIAAEIE